MNDPLFFILAGVAAAFAVVWAVRRAFSFAGQDAADYMHLMPELDLRRHLAGKLICTGTIFGPTGRVTSRFRATMTMDWDGDKGAMVEQFTYDDGTVQDRVWLIELLGDGHVQTEATDVLGHGAGRIMGNALGLQYRIQLPAENGGYVLSAVDWMYLQEDGTILNRSQFRKFGIKVAELFAVIRPAGEDDHA